MVVVSRVLLVPYLVVLGLIVFLPAREASTVTGLVGWTADLLEGWFGLPREPTAVAIEFTANIALFVPLGVLLMLAFPSIGPWPVVAIGLVVSTVIELVQLGVPSRVSTVSDVMANTTGTAIGVFVILLVRQSALRRGSPAT